MKFGTHVSAAGGLDKTFERAHAVGAAVFQCFSRPPQGGKAPEITADIAANFASERKKYKINEYFIHTPYFINLASANNKLRHFSLSVLADELKRGSLLDFQYVNTHIGSAGEQSMEEGIEVVVKGIIKILEKYEGTTGLLIETSAGAGKIIGAKFEDIARILDGVDKKCPKKLNVCLDTCHVFACGYDLRDAGAVKQTIDEFDKRIGLDRLKFIHGNDSKFGLGECKDRHEHIGQGEIGLEGFRAIVNEPRLQKLNFILETPKDNPEDDPKNLAVLKKIYKGK